MGLPCVSAILFVLVTAVLSEDMPPGYNEVRRPPKIDVFLNDTRFRPGTDNYLDFICKVSGIPEPSVRWEKDGTTYDFSGAGGIPIEGGYRIRGPGKLSEGKYQCFATNSHGTAMSTIATITRAYIDDYQEKPSARNYEVKEGNSLQVYVKSLTSNPAPTYTWSRANDISDKYPIPIRPDRRRTVDDNGNLLFVYTEPSDGGTQLYKCDIRNSEVDIAKGGSYSRVNVLPGPKTPKAPELMFRSGPVVQILEGVAEVTLRCIFSGFPLPTVYWTGNLPQDHTTDNHLLIIREPKVEHSGTYQCRASNDAGQSQQHSIELKVEVKPNWVKRQGKPIKPMDMNVTEGENATFMCEGEGVPAVTRQWLINAEDASGVIKPNLVISGEYLTVTNVSKARFDGSSDLMNVQCKVENTHRVLIGGGYLNVLAKTRIQEKPASAQLVYGEPVVFKCQASSDPSTPVTVDWLWRGRPLVYDSMRYKQADNSLRIETKDAEQQGAEFKGLYTCVANNQYSQETASAELTLPAGPVPVKTGSMWPYWWIFVIIAVVLLLLLLILFCCLCYQRNKGEEYPVDEKERKNGNDPEKELADSGFHDYQRPEDEPIKGSRASLNSSMKLDSDDEDLAEYGDIDTGKFNEDGSFIGQYAPDEKEPTKEPPAPKIPFGVKVMPTESNV